MGSFSGSRYERAKRGLAQCYQKKDINVARGAAGYATLLVLILLMILSGLGMESYLKANADLRMTKRFTQSIQALYAAEGGVEWGKAHLLAGSDLRQGSLDLSEGRVEVVITVSEGGYTVTSEGWVGLAARKIEQNLQLIDEKLAAVSYQELRR